VEKAVLRRVAARLALVSLLLGLTVRSPGRCTWLNLPSADAVVDGRNAQYTSVRRAVDHRVRTVITRTAGRGEA